MNPASPLAPRATYRLQLNPSFGFAQAGEVAGYLAALGISHVYCSPYLQATPGSTHGYDVLDHQSINAELGGTLGHEQFSNTLRQNNLRQVLDVVPNHMSIAHSENRWWWDVLENGPASRYAGYFDVDWEPREQKLHNRVLLPILADHYGRAIESHEIRLEREGGAFRVRYRDHLLPLAPRTLDEILSAAADVAGSDMLAFAADVAGHLPAAERTDRKSVNRRHRDKEILRRLLENELRAHPDWAAAIDKVLDDINRSNDALDALLERQNYRLAFWRMAKQDLDYRRFFDINTLVGLRMEDDRVFAETHALILHLLEGGEVDGLRIDHPDGLREPQQYFQRLADAAPNAWIVAEKILTPGECLPQSWPVAGTTGYDFLNAALGLFIDPNGEVPLTEFYAEFTGESTDYKALAREKKHLVMRDLLASDIHRLAAQLAEVCEFRRRYRDYSRRELNTMLREVIACLSVYRTYVQPEQGQIGEADQLYINRAIDEAKTNRPDLDAELLEFFRSILLLQSAGPLETELVMRFQQCTGSVMAKGVEDTLFYSFNRFIALNEVGGAPDHFSNSVEDFHARQLEISAQHPRTMLATTTHDTKRSEDVRMRLALLSEMPNRWATTVRKWAKMNEAHRSQFQPDRNLEYHYYQTLVGAWPIDASRLLPYLLKAVREAKQFTTWTAPNNEYEQALTTFVEKSLASPEFRASVEQFVQELKLPAWINSLSQTLLKLTVPGVPDIYQGSELWDLRLVDPDNRGPVDFRLRRQLLEQMEGLSPEEILRRWEDGLPKLWLIQRTLRFRLSHPELFDGANYRPVYGSGSKASHVVAFTRGSAVMTVVPRLVFGLNSQWNDTQIEVPPGKWINVFTNAAIASGNRTLSEILARFPVALLTRSDIKQESIERGRSIV